MPNRDHIWLLWEWAEDASLVHALISRASQSGLCVKTFTPADFVDFDLNSLIGHPPVILWDRAGDIHPEALRISDWAEALGSRVINPVRGTLLARDKARLHELLVKHNLPVPITRLVRAESPPEDLDWGCGKYLVLKPELSGGGEGVRIQEWCEDTLRSTMRSRPLETWLLQEHVEPAIIGGKRAWFRVYNMFGDIRICWWDNRTHIYDFLPESEVNAMGFNDLELLGMKMGSSFPMQFFSTEIVYREDGKPVIVDYINDPCDLRCKTDFLDGVPVELLDWVFWKLFGAAKEAVQ
jgi:hypothetical protein